MEMPRRDDRDQNASRWLVWFAAVATVIIGFWLIAVVFTYSS